MFGSSESINAEMQHANYHCERKWQVLPTLMSCNEIDVFCILEANDTSALSSQEADFQAFPRKLKMAVSPTQVVEQSNPPHSCQQDRGGREQLELPQEREWQSPTVGRVEVGVYYNKEVHARGSVYYFAGCLSSNLTTE